MATHIEPGKTYRMSVPAGGPHRAEHVVTVESVHGVRIVGKQLDGAGGPFEGYMPLVKVLEEVET